MMTVLVVILLVSVLPAFSSGNQEKAVAEKAPEKTISLLCFLKPGGSSPREQGAGELLKVFTEKTGYGLTTEVVGWEQVEPKLFTAVESGNPPDVTFVRSQSLTIEASAGVLMPLDDFIKRDFDKETQADFLLWDQLGMYEGKKYAIPMSIIPYGVYVRDDLMKKAGITEDPKTWDEFIEVAQKLNSDSTTGFLFYGSSAQPAAIDYLQPMIESFGGKILDKDGRGVFDSPEALKAFRLIKRMAFEAMILPSNVASLKYDEASDMYAAGRAALYYDGAHRASKYVQGVGQENLRLIQMPSETGELPGPSYVSGWWLGIPANSKNPEMAWEYIKNFVTSENQTTYAKISGEVPVRKSAIEGDKFFEEDPNGQRIKWFVDYVATNGTVCITPTDYTKLNELLSIAVQEIVMNKNSNVDAIVAKACKEYNAAK